MNKSVFFLLAAATVVAASSCSRNRKDADMAAEVMTVDVAPIFAIPSLLLC